MVFGPSNTPSTSPPTSIPSTTPTQEPSVTPTATPSNHPSMSPTRTMCSNVWSTTETLPVEVDYLGNWTTVFHYNDVSTLVSSWKENETYSMIITASSDCSSDMHLGWSGFDNGGFIFDVPANSDEITLLSSDVIPAGTGTNAFTILPTTTTGCTNFTVTVHHVQFLVGNCTSAMPTKGPTVAPSQLPSHAPIRSTLPEATTTEEATKTNDTMETTQSAGETTEDGDFYGSLTIQMAFENVTVQEFHEHNGTVLDILAQDLNADPAYVYWSNISITNMTSRRRLSDIFNLIYASAGIKSFSWLEHNTMVEKLEEIKWQDKFSDECAALFSKDANTFQVYITEVDHISDESAAEIVQRNDNDNNNEESMTIGLIVGLLIVCAALCFCCGYCSSRKNNQNEKDSDLEDITLCEKNQITYNLDEEFPKAKEIPMTKGGDKKRRNYNVIHE